ncbi:MAG: hypothetical protein Q9222_000609 [Ikaeria aurantiellina]
MGRYSAPGEESAAAGLVAIIFYLFVDVNLGVYRIFKKKQGLYYWCILLGSWGCLLNAIAIVLKCFVHDSQPLWPLYTLFILLGWTIYAPAQLLTLYSRLHLVNRNRGIQRWVLVMIVVVASLMIIPTWPLVWQAYNPYDSHLSSLYSPREAIIDRCTQIGYTLAETVLSGIYIRSLTKLLRVKSSVRQRRVMTDLIYVNIIAVCLDIITVILVFVNEVGISHPIQTFSYIIKFKLEFLVLNQLMAVAAKGVRKESFAERRYHHPSAPSDKGSSLASSDTSGNRSKSHGEHRQRNAVREIVVPPPALSKAQDAADSRDSPSSNHHGRGRRWPLKAILRKRAVDTSGTATEDEEDEEIGVHMWERRGKLVMEVRFCYLLALLFARFSSFSLAIIPIPKAPVVAGDTVAGESAGSAVGSGTRAGEEGCCAAGETSGHSGGRGTSGAIVPEHGTSGGYA